MKWIDVNERLPEREPDKWSKPVICFADNGEVFVLSIINDYWQRSSLFVNSGAKKIMAWIPMPEFE